jgi:hypothetical protein
MSCPIITDKMLIEHKKTTKIHNYDNSNEEKYNKCKTNVLQKDYTKIVNKRKEKFIYLRNRERYNFK